MLERARQILTEQIKIDEGKRLKPYKCSSGKLTIGYGRNIEDNGITEHEALIMLQTDIEKADADCKMWLPDIYDWLSPVRQAVIANMMINMGYPTLKQFKNFKQALMKGDFAKASEEMLNSRWAKQVGDRALRLARQMRTGVLS